MSALTLERIKEVNQDFKNTRATSPVGVFVGATSGIGEHTAYAFAKYTVCPTVYIVGRNIEAGERVISHLKTINSNPDARYYSYGQDLSLLKQCNELCDKIVKNESKINLLFLSSGVLNLDGRTETDEGIDGLMAVAYYSRWRIINNLIPLLQIASEQDENARVVSVLAAGNEGKVDQDDFYLKKSK
jgi:NAD(P)-dependent dehydrogenase (short-subunit alcohol dehydrogenase family)